MVDDIKIVWNSVFLKLSDTAKMHPDAGWRGCCLHTKILGASKMSWIKNCSIKTINDLGAVQYFTNHPTLLFGQSNK